MLKRTSCSSPSEFDDEQEEGEEEDAPCNWQPRESEIAMISYDVTSDPLATSFLTSHRLRSGGHRLTCPFLEGGVKQATLAVGRRRLLSAGDACCRQATLAVGRRRRV